MGEAGGFLCINFPSFGRLQNVKTKKKVIETQLPRVQIKWEAYLLNSNKMFKIINMPSKHYYSVMKLVHNIWSLNNTFYY